MMSGYEYGAKIGRYTWCLAEVVFSSNRKRCLMRKDGSGILFGEEADSGE
jgi:hypothetical protein